MVSDPDPERLNLCSSARSLAFLAEILKSQ
jgi:hypothetical protein